MPFAPNCASRNVAVFWGTTGFADGREVDSIDSFWEPDDLRGANEIELEAGAGAGIEVEVVEDENEEEEEEEGKEADAEGLIENLEKIG